MKPAVLIINPTVSPVYLNERFKEAGFFILACFTSREIDYLVKPSLENKLFDSITFLSKDFDKDVALISNIIREHDIEIKLALSSSEYDLRYSDKLAYYFCSNYSNNPETSSWRCNKRLMNERLCKNGTLAAKQRVIVDSNQLDLEGFDYPVVVKPAEGGGGSIGVAQHDSNLFLNQKLSYKS